MSKISSYAECYSHSIHVGLRAVKGLLAAHEPPVDDLTPQFVIRSSPVGWHVIVAVPEERTEGCSGSDCGCAI